MKGQEVLYFINQKMESRYSDIGGLPAIRRRLKYSIIYTNIFEEFRKDDQGIILTQDEFPIIECTLPNGNYFLMSTLRMVSVFQNTRYELPYSEYLWHDSQYMAEALPFNDNSPKTLKYYSRDKSIFIFEIESGLLLDVAHNCVLYNLR